MKINKALFSLASVLVSTALFAESAPELPPAANTEIPAVAAAPAENKFDFLEQNGQKFILVAQIPTVEANDEFAKNVGIMDQLRKSLLTLNEHKKIAFTEEEKAATDKKIAELTEELKKADATMAKAYGYSISRDYVHRIVETVLCLKLTDEEYEKAKAETGINPEKDLLVKGDDKYRRIAVIPDERANDEFRLNVQKMIALRERVVQMNKIIEKMPAGEEKTKASEEFEKEKKQLEENNEKMVKAYGYSVARSYLMEIAKSKLYVKVNEEEFLKAKKLSEEASIRADAKSVLAE